MNQQSTNNSNVRTLNYLGSKLRLLDFIEEQTKRVTPVGTGVCDLFAGSGCVSYKLSLNFPITACDIQYYSTVICEALLQPHTISENEIDGFINSIMSDKAIALEDAFSPLIKKESDAINSKRIEVLTDIVEHGSVEVFRLEKSDSSLTSDQMRVIEKLSSANLMNKDSLFSRYYGGVYFSYLQAVQIDLILSAISKITDYQRKNIFLAALLSTASDIVNTVGKHFAQPIKAHDSKGCIKPLVFRKALKDKTIDVLSLYQEWLRLYVALPHNHYGHTSMQSDYMECLEKLPKSVHTVYADPPYTRDHYSRFYHVLETMALGDVPQLSSVTIHGTSRISNGIYRKDRYQSPFCIRSKAPQAFRDMFDIISATHRNLLLSYSPYDESKKTHPRVVTMKQLVSWAEEYFAEVEVVSAGHFSHNKLNSTEPVVSLNVC